MNDDPLPLSTPVDLGEAATRADQADGSHNIAAASDLHSDATALVIAQINGANINRSNGDSAMDKSDSEAETVVMSGKEEEVEQEMKKAIKLEEASVAETATDEQSPNLPTIRETEREGSKEDDGRKPSLKRKRMIAGSGSGDVPDTGNSSNLSSTVSSPAQAVHFSKATDTASDRSRSSPPLEEAAQQLEGKARKQRSGSDSAHNSRQAGKSDRETGLTNPRKRRETRSVTTQLDEPNHRSESPPSRKNNRAQSIQATNSYSNGVVKRRKAPASLHVERRRKASEDAHPDSDDSSSAHSRHHLQKTSADGNAMSPAKITISHKKNRDRSGRTLLARACAQDAVEAERWLRDRPQDIDVPDNAGNTPLQIAALEGDVQVVQLLLDAGCDTTSKNIDKDTPLIDAVENGHLEVVRLLLRAGLDPRQKNAKGQEPLELVPADDEEAEDIREALLASKKERDSLRRPSEDHHRHSTGSRDVEQSSTGASGASPTRSPPPPAPGVRRRTARSQPTDDALLWVNPTPERLRDAAGKGDITIVDHILKMRPKVDTEAVIAAARGGHDGVLNLMMAIGNMDSDPEPLRSGEYKPASSTPMLAAIGRGNISVIELLLNQPGFDPTRRRLRDLTYYDISKERQGLEWQEEYDILKEAYDNYKPNGGRRSNNNSPRKVRTKRADSSKHSSEPSTSPHDSRKIRRSKTLPDDDQKEGSGKESSQLYPDKGTGSRQLGEELRKQHESAIVSDRDSDALGIPKTKHKGSTSNDVARPAVNRTDSLKPKRRLMSGNDFRTDKDLKRRSSHVTEARDDSTRRKSGDSISGRNRKSSDASESTAKISKASSEEPANVKSDFGKKRHRISVSPQASKGDLSATTEVAKKKKRRVDSQGNAIDQDRDRSFRPGPAMVANMIANPSAIPSPTMSQGTAPVAFMGSNTGSPVLKSPMESRINSTLISPVNSIDQALQQQHQPELDDVRVQRQVEEDMLRQEKLDQGRGRQTAQEEKELPGEVESEKRRQVEAEAERKARAEREEAERKARLAQDEEDARLEVQRQVEEEQRQMQLEREEEENRIAKKKREEEMQQRRKENEERRRHELEERRRQELEERESKRRLQAQEEAERLRRQSLPNGLRRAAELSPEDARTTKEVTKWLPFRTVTTQELDRGCEPQMAEEKWIANIQAAPILAIQDLELSQYTAWSRLPATINHHGSLWRQLRNPMSQARPPAFLSPTDVYNLDQETRPKFFALKHVFWIKLSDFMDIVPRHPHLAGIKLNTRAMVLHEFPFGRGGTWDKPGGIGGSGGGEEAVKQEAVASPVMNGNMTNGHR